MKLWNRVGEQNSAKAQQSAQQQQQHSVSGLAAHLRPAFFTAPSSTAAPGFKPLQSVANRPNKSTAAGNGPTAQQAMLANLATQTFVQRMSGAFWEAFSGAPSSSSRPGLDADKVRRVLEGKAVVRIVDIEPSTSTTSIPSSSSATTFGKRPVSPKILATSAAADSLEEKMRSMSLSADVKAKSGVDSAPHCLKECRSKIVLCEGMREATGLYAAVAARK